MYATLGTGGRQFIVYIKSDLLILDLTLLGRLRDSGLHIKIPNQDGEGVVFTKIILDLKLMNQI
jgi:hypothetical protein